ncbi:unnamed protein product [Allacma fusca]|uniref:RRM domain-containing protein n=1 Tax=Allacma fusca TaxID=39272 RepID=A0A8J2PV13_9HEXA|nr:unnamed protein product [Allacma fusca]
MNPPHHHPGVTIGPLPIGMVTAHGAGGPVGIGIGVPIMTAAPIVPAMPPQAPQQPPKKLVSPDSSEDGKDIINALKHRTPSPHSPHSTNGTSNGNGNLSWTNQILQPITGMGYPVMGMGVMGPPPVLPEPSMLYGIISSSPSELNIPQSTNSNSVNVNLPNGAIASSVPVPLVNNGNSTPQQQHAKEIIHCKSCTLFPPNPSAPPPTTREKPPGCRTVFVGGLPENVTDEIIREIFERCGEITTIRMSKKNFCHIRFELESFIENAIYLSGYRVRIGSNSDAANIGRLHVDYAQARDDLYEWECRERKLLRERRHRARIEQERLLPPSPPPVVHYSEHEAVNLSERLKGDETFIKAVQVLITWLDRGDCSKRNANCFYSMIQSTNSHVRRLLGEKSQYDEELNKAKELMRQRMQGLLMQFSQIEKVFLAACHKKAWDHFTKAQRKNIDMWKKQAGEIKNMQLEEALNERTDEEMELSDTDSESGDTGSPRGKKMRVDEDKDKTVNQLKEENDSLRCQLEAFKNEVDLIKADLKTELEAKDQQLRDLQKQLLQARRSLPKHYGHMNGNSSLQQEDPSSTGSTNSALCSPKATPNGDDKLAQSENPGSCDSSSNSISSIQTRNNHQLNGNNNCEAWIIPSDIKITEPEARLIADRPIQIVPNFLELTIEDIRSKFGKHQQKILVTRDENTKRHNSHLKMVTPIKSPVDPQSYRVIQLQNGLKALLITSCSYQINDSSQKKCAAKKESANCTNRIKQFNRENIVGGEDEEVVEGSSLLENVAEISNSPLNPLTEEKKLKAPSNNSETPKLTEKQKQHICKESRKFDMMACVSLCVGAGYFDDPPDLPGAAHLLEHLLLMGCEKYPESTFFDEFLSFTGGTPWNGNTDGCRTVYYFDTSVDYLAEALDILASHLKVPLLSPELISIERENVDGEFRKAIPGHQFRFNHFLQQLATPGHPYHAFSWGNAESLSRNKTDFQVSEALKTFFHRYYSADLMYLTVQAALTLSELEAKVVASMSDVPRRPVKRVSFTDLPMPFSNCKFSKLYRVQAVTDVRMLIVTWQLPSEAWKDYNAKSLDYIAYVLLNENVNGLPYFLRKEGLITEVSMNPTETNMERSDACTIFGIHFTLTAYGLDNYKEVLRALFSYIKLMKIEGPQFRLFAELSKARAMEFHFIRDGDLGLRVKEISEAMRVYKSEDVLCGPILMRKYDPELISRMTCCLRPEEANFILFSKDFESVVTKKEKYFGIEYDEEDFDPLEMRNLRKIGIYSCFDFCLPNPFITTNFCLVKPTFREDIEQLMPICLHHPKYPVHEQPVHLWFFQDEDPMAPQGVYTIALHSPIGMESAENATILDILALLLQDQFKGCIYSAGHIFNCRETHY